MSILGAVRSGLQKAIRTKSARLKQIIKSKRRTDSQIAERTTSLKLRSRRAALRAAAQTSSVRKAARAAAAAKPAAPIRAIKTNKKNLPVARPLQKKRRGGVVVSVRGGKRSPNAKPRTALSKHVPAKGGRGPVRVSAQGVYKKRRVVIKPVLKGKTLEEHL